jgi:hypothetical protein
MSIMKQYTVILPDVIAARSEQAAWDAFLEYMGECHLMGDVTCFDFVEVKPTTKQQHHKTNSNMNMTPEQMTAIRCAYADLQGSAQDNLSLMGGTHDWKAHAQSIADLEREFPFLVDRLPHIIVDGYWVDDRTEFEGYVISQSNDIEEDDDSIFFYGLSESKIAESLGKETGEDFVITRYEVKS